MSFGMVCRDDFGRINFRVDSSRLTRIIHRRTVTSWSGTHVLGRLSGDSEHPVAYVMPAGITSGHTLPATIMAWITKAPNGIYTLHWGEDNRFIFGQHNENVQLRRAMPPNGFHITVFAYA